MSPTRRPTHTFSTQAPSIPVDTHDAVEVDAASLLSLRLRVHTLETALEEQNASLVDARAQLAESSLRGGDLERVQLIIEALRQRVSGDDEKVSVLNRLEAALVRLSASPRPQRPALPTPVASTRSAPAAPPPSVMPGAIPLAPLAAPHRPPLVDFPTPPPTPAATPDPESAPPHTVKPVPEEAVLPVPPPPVQSTAHGRRWRRRGILRALSPTDTDPPPFP